MNHDERQCTLCNAEARYYVEDLHPAGAEPIYVCEMHFESLRV